MKAFPRPAGPPAAEPVTLAEALSHLRVDADGGANDAYILTLIKAAREACESRTERTLVNTPLVLKLDAFADAIELLRPPIISVSAVKYLDSVGDLQTIDPVDYEVDTASEPGWLVPAPGLVWPVAAIRINAVTVEYTAGYGATAADVPAKLKQWILLAVQHMYDERGWDVPEQFAPGLINTERLLGI